MGVMEWLFSNKQDYKGDLLLNKINMEKCQYSRNGLEQQVTFSTEFTDQKKPLQVLQHPRYLQKIENVSLQQPSEAFMFQEKSSSNIISAIMPKEIIMSNKRTIIVPKKVFYKDKCSSPQDKHFLPYGHMRFLNEQLTKEKHSFSAALAQIQCQEGQRSPVIRLSKNSDRAQIYQPLKKKSSMSQKDKLKPITTSAQLGNEQSSFFSVQKMTLLEGEKSKKSKSLIVNINGQNLTNPNFIIKQTNNSRILKNLNFAKGRWNIQRIVSLNEQIKLQQDKKLKNIITISPVDIGCEQKSHMAMQRQINSAKFFNEACQSEDIHTTNCNKQSEIQNNINIKQETTIEVVSTDIQVVNKQKVSPAKRSRRKFNIPFQTYHYRDLLWKANYTNSLYVEVPIEYEHRLKVYVGRGNNSCMVSGLIARRPWYAFTDRVDEANFVWSQIKILNYFKLQKPILREDNTQFQEVKYKKQSIVSELDDRQYKSYFNIYLNTEQHNDQRLQSRAKLFKYKKYIKVNEIKQTKMHNHLINNYVIGNKKALFNTMSNYYKEMNLDVFDFLPLTFHIKDGLEDKKYFQFLRYYHKRAKEITKNNEDKTKTKQYNAWIVKPGQNSNRGNGIKMCLSLQDIKKVLKERQKYADGTYRTYIVQAYIQRPLLYYKRKFDLRHYIMMTSINGYIKGYWYKDGYVRTTSSEYTLVDNNGGIHLTNDAVQKNLPNYGKYEKGNKISYDELACYIQKYHSKKGKKFYQHIYPKMQRIATDAIRACSGGIDPGKLSNNFQIFGLDYMIDINLNVWLIEINTNPCLQLSCPLLSFIIPKFIENTLELTLDCMFPPPVRYTPKGVHYFKQLQKENRFSLVYDERCQKLYRGSLQVLDNKLLQQQDDTFEDCGDEWEDN